MRLRFAQVNADAQNGAFAIRADAQGDEHRAVHQHPTMAHLLVACIEDQVRAGTQRPIAPQLEFGIELGGTGAHLGGTHAVAAEFLDDLGDFARGYALDIHLGHGQVERLLAAHAFFQGAGIEVDAVTHLGNAKFDRAHAGGEGFGLEAIGMSES